MKTAVAICTFPIEINPTMYDATKDQMSYADFIIFKEQKFLRNIFSEKELSTTDALKNLEIYHQKFTKFLQLSIYLQNSINTIKEFDDCPHEELQDFISEFCQDCVDFAEINEKIIEVEMKNTYRTKIAKKTLQSYAFVYQRIMDFPHNKFDYKTVATNDLFVYVHKIFNVKIHLHHSHVRGKIKGDAHYFCNEKVRENKDAFSCVVHNFFGFDIYFLIKGIRLSVWESKDINIGGTGLTNINYGSLMDMKFIDTMKYFVTSLGKLA